MRTTSGGEMRDGGEMHLDAEEMEEMQLAAPSVRLLLLAMALLTMAALTIAALTMATLTMATLTMATLTMATVTMALLYAGSNMPVGRIPSPSSTLS